MKKAKVKKEQRGVLCGTLLDKLGERIRWSVLEGKRMIRAGDRMIRLGHVF